MNSRLYLLVVPWILLALISGMLGGLSKLGWNIPATSIAAWHGLIMVGGFLGTVISFEKTIPFKSKGWLIIPILSGFSILILIAGNYKIALIIQLLSSFGFVLVMFKWLRRTKDHYYRIMVVGALSWMIAISGIIAGRTIPSIVPWWIAFILFIISGERLELTKFLPTSRKTKLLLYMLLVLFLAGLFIPFQTSGKYLLGISLLGTGIWLLNNDIVKISLKKSGRHQYIAIHLLSGYIWLIIAGLLIGIWPRGPYTYDAMVHSFFLGFAFSMIFAHAPVILPGILKRNIDPYTRSLYIWIFGFQFSLILRIFGDLLEIQLLRMAGGMGNALFILCFFANMIYNVKKASRINIPITIKDNLN